MAWPSSLAFEWQPAEDPWERQAAFAERKVPLGEVDSNAPEAEEDEPPPPFPQPEAAPDARRRRKSRPTSVGALRLAAAASNTPTFIAQAQRRAAMRAARRRSEALVAGGPTRGDWDATPLSKLCDRDAARVANVEHRRRELQRLNNRRYSHRDGEDDAAIAATRREEAYPALAAAREEIRKAKILRAPGTTTTRQATVASSPPRTRASRAVQDDDDDDGRREDDDQHGHRRSSSPPPPRVLDDDGPPPYRTRLSYAVESNCECVGEPRRTRRTLGADERTRSTSPFDLEAARRALDAFEQHRRRPEEEEVIRIESDLSKGEHRAPRIRSTTRDDLERRTNVGVVEDIGALTRAVAGLVGSAAKTVELHEHAQRQNQQREHSLAAFSTWQARAQQHLDASLRLQQQQLNATLADFRHHASYGPPFVAGLPAATTWPPQSAGQAPAFGGGAGVGGGVAVPAPAVQPSHERRPTYLPFGGTTPQLPRDDVALVERLWEKLSEIEEDERGVAAALARKPPREGNVFAADDDEKAPVPRDDDKGATIYLPADGSDVSLPLGVVASLVVDREDDDQGPDDDDDDGKKKPATSKNAIDRVWAERTAGPRRKDDDDDSARRRADGGGVGVEASLRVLDYRTKTERFRKLAEADLLDTGLAQTAVVDALADELLEGLLDKATNEVDSALRDCSETILDRA